MDQSQDNPIVDETLPADLADIAALLDRAGAANRAAMPGRAIERVAAASTHAMLNPESVEVASAVGAVAIDARVAAASGPEGLEERVFLASREALVSAPALRLAGEGTLPPPRVLRPIRTWIPAALAAMLTIAGAGLVLYLRTNVATPDAVGVPNGGNITTASFETEMENFLDLLESAPETDIVETTTDFATIDELLDWESL